MVDPSPPLGKPIDPPANVHTLFHPSLYRQYVPMDVVVHSRGTSSQCSIVSDITHPKELSPLNDIYNGDIAEMKRRLEAIKERRARIKGRHRQEIPHVVVSDQKYRLPKQPGETETTNRSTYGNAYLDEPSHPTDTDKTTVSFVPAKAWPTNYLTNVPAISKRRIGISNNPSELLRVSGVSISPKSIGVSTCRTFDETLLSHDDNNGHFTNSNVPWDVRRLLCTSSKPMTNTVDMEFGQIQSCRSIDICGGRRQDLALLERGWNPTDNELSGGSLFVPRAVIPKSTEEREDGTDKIHQENISIDLEALPSCNLSSPYPRPDIPGQAYSEIVSESSRFTVDPDLMSVPPRSKFSSCFRRDPWYMTRRMKTERDVKCTDLLQRHHTMHAVVFMKQNQNDGQ
jgi:hypothetical protein